MQQENALQLARIRDLVANYQYKIEGKWFHSQQLVFDGFAFVRCRFDGCWISVRRGDFVLDHCYFNNCTIFFQDDALTSVRFYNVFSIPPESFPDHIRPIRHEDGTVSVSKAEHA